MDKTNVRIPALTHQRAELAITLLKPGKSYTLRSFAAEAIENLIGAHGLTDKINRALGHKSGSTHKTTKTQ